MKTVIKSVSFVTALSLSTLTSYAETTDTQTNLNTTTTNSSNSSTNNSATNPSSNSSTNPLGNYQCQQTGSSNNTTSYSLTVSKAGDTYTFEWADNTGDPVYYGTGVMIGSLPNAISVSFWDPKKPDMIGIEVFELKSDGSLDGNWTLQSDNRIGGETCTKSKSTT